MRMSELERETMKKTAWRIVPLLALVLMFNYLDKVNLGFAAVTMNQALGLSKANFGAGAGFFAFGYALFAIPSTLMLHRWGARRWIGITMIAWGLCSAATAFVKHPQGLYVVRFFLGMAEAGFTPGAMLYFSYWFPNRYRGRVLGIFLLIYPLGLIVGGPASSGLFLLDGVAGLAGWQWLFLVEALPTLALSFLVFGFLIDRPADASWLSPMEKSWLNGVLTHEKKEALGAKGESGWQSFKNKRVWMLAIVSLGLATSGIGPLFFLPLMIRSIGFSVIHTGLIVALPGIAAAVSLPLWGIWTDRAQRRETVVAAACLAIALGLAGSAVLLPSPWTILALSVAMVGFHGGLVSFWTLPTTFLVGASAATGIAFINIAGNLGTFTGPYLLGWLADQTQTYTLSLICLAAIAIATALYVSTQSSLKQPVTART
jgi:ACS family tartrate transporter-like MFS transporter